jgi:hypothetical protein
MPMFLLIHLIFFNESSHGVATIFYFADHNSCELATLDPMLLKGLNESPINKPLLKSCFLDIDKKKMENVNQGG